MNSQKRFTPGGDVDHPNDKGINHQWMDGRKMKNPRNLLCPSQVHRLSRYGKRRWHHYSHYHKRCDDQGLHLWDWMMHLKNDGLFSSQVLSRGLKNLNPCHEVTSVIIHIYFLVLHELFSL
jgi:hypothetical protein